MDELMLGSGVVAPVPFTGRKGRAGVAEKHVDSLFPTALQLSVMNRLISKPAVVQLHP